MALYGFGRRKTREVITRRRYIQPAGFWIRVVATLIDGLVFLPLGAVNVWAFFSLKSLPLVLLLYVPGLLYKPCMESFFGATLGKMVCGVMVVDDSGDRLSLGAAYFRFSLNLPSLVMAVLGAILVFALPEFQAANGIAKASRVASANSLHTHMLLATIPFYISCLAIPFSERKRALHDFMAGSYCVYTNG